MRLVQQSKQWGYRVGQYLAILCSGVMAYSLYGLVYWLSTGKIYFGWWDLGLCGMTVYFCLTVKRACTKIHDKENYILNGK